MGILCAGIAAAVAGGVMAAELPSSRIGFPKGRGPSLKGNDLRGQSPGFSRGTCVRAQARTLQIEASALQIAPQPSMRVD